MVNQRNPIFNTAKTKSMLFLTHEVSKLNKLHEKQTFSISNNDKEIELVKSTKLLGVTFNENLKWDDHVYEILKASYNTLFVH